MEGVYCRHRLVVPKYNPARTFTEEGTVGIGGCYMCIYPMDSPGGYQLVGRTLPIWNTYGRAGPFTPSTPWLLRIFDQVPSRLWARSFTSLHCARSLPSLSFPALPLPHFHRPSGSACGLSVLLDTTRCVANPHSRFLCATASSRNRFFSLLGGRAGALLSGVGGGAAGPAS
jgi:Carboxyltransferase domain, subdomain C and D